MKIENLEEIGDTKVKTDDVLLNLKGTEIVDRKSGDNDAVNDAEMSKSEDLSTLGSEVNKMEENIVSENNCPMEIKKNMSIDGALSAIAMEYNSSDSETEEIPEPTQNSHAAITNQENLIPLDSVSEEVTEPIQKSQAENVNSFQEEEIVVLKEYRTNIEITCSSDEVDSEDDSSSSECDSEASKSDSSSDSSEEEADIATEEKSQQAMNTNQRFKKENKGDFDDLPPIEELHITVPEVLCDPLGEVSWIVDQMVVVRPKPGKPTLNLDSILFVERGRRVLGRIFDVFGQVSDPHYCVRFNNSKHIEESNIQVGMNVYFCPNTEYTSLVFLHELTKKKAADPTDDDENPEFSDDEEEQAYYQNLRKQQKNEKTESGSEIPNKKKRTTDFKSANTKKSAGPKSGWQSHHPWNTKRNMQKQNHGNGCKQNSTGSQQANSQSWYGASSYQQNLWPQFSQFPNPAWSMFYPPQPYGDANNFRPQIGFRPPFSHPRFPNSMHWNVRSQSHSSQSFQTENLSVGNLMPITSPPPPPPPPGV